MHSSDSSEPSTPSGPDAGPSKVLAAEEMSHAPASGELPVPEEVSAAGVIDRPFRELLKIAAPTVATMTSYTLMTFVDKLMSSRIGPDPIYVGAQGNGGLSSWVAISVFSGLLSIINTYVSQNLGAGRADRAPAYAWNGLWIALGAFVLVMIPYGVALPSIYHAMRDTSLSPEQIARVVLRDQIATEYARVLIFFSLFTMTRLALAQYFYGMHRPMVVLVACVAANLTNFVINSVLIYGPQAPAPVGNAALDWWFAHAADLARALGIPRLGVVGSGYGTVVATLVELLILMGVFLSAKYQRLFKTRDHWRLSMQHIKDLLKLGWPAGLMFGNEMVCWGLFMVYFVGHFGTEHSTAGWIAHQWMSLSFMPAVGISVAVTAMVGKCMGMKRPDLAAQRAWMGLRVAMVYMGICGVCFVVFRRELIGLFLDSTTPPEQAARLVALGGKFLILTAIFQLFDAVAMATSGALRGAGDTVFPGVVTVVASWVLIVGGGWATITYFPQWESLGPWGASSVYIITLSLFLLGRFLSGKWKQIKLVNG
jgi:multidrug resistance protein, MATE family